jgi:hypothetical protein
MSRDCTCKEWNENIDEINGYIETHAMRYETEGYTGPKFKHCPWCGSTLRIYGTLSPEENVEAFRDLTNALHEKLARHPEAGVRRVFVDNNNKIKMWIELDHQVYKDRINKYMIEKVEPITEHIDGKYHFKIWDKENDIPKYEDTIIPTTLDDEELDKLFRELGDI